MNSKISIKQMAILALFIVFIFQSALEKVFPLFSYTDEFIIIVAVFFMSLYIGKTQETLKNKQVVISIFLIFVYLVVGVMANVLYKYQEVRYVILDIIANLKFFFSIAAGYLILRNQDWQEIKGKTSKILIAFSYMIFSLVILDQALGIWPGQIRYGIKSEQMFFSHSTYLAAAMAFIVAYLTATFQKKNLIPIILDLIVIMFTLRSKAIVSAAVYAFLFWLLIMKKKKLKIWQIVLLGVLAVIVGWGQINYYFIVLKGASARSIMISTSIKIMKDYFPIGTGFGTYASHSAAANYSPVYDLYGFFQHYELRASNPNAFLDDTFWPIIFGQTGVIGTFSYITVLGTIVKNCFSIGKKYKFLYLSSLFVIAYLLIGSVAEPSFNNSIAVPLGFLLGMIFREVERMKKNEQSVSNSGSSSLQSGENNK